MEDELASFRRDWREEIRRTVTEGGSSRNSPVLVSPAEPQTSTASREGSPNSFALTTKNTVNAGQNLEERVNIIIDKIFNYLIPYSNTLMSACNNNIIMTSNLYM